jgi:hypothetical protein
MSHLLAKFGYEIAEATYRKLLNARIMFYDVTPSEACEQFYEAAKAQVGEVEPQCMLAERI